LKLRHVIIRFENVFTIRRTKIKRYIVDVCSESTEDRDWSEESQTFYYSSFELFDTNEDISKFYQYSLFVDQILLELGEEWKAEAQILYSPHFTGQ
jgi:hypothetical protein